jgi:hypothetical protein
VGSRFQLELIENSSYLYNGNYTLPLNTSLGATGTGEVIITGETATDRTALSDTAEFAYGHFDSEGGDIELGKMVLQIPNDALKNDTFITMMKRQKPQLVSENGKTAADNPGELIITGTSYDIGPASLQTEKPFRLALNHGPQGQGAAIYRKRGESLEFAGAFLHDGSLDTRIHGGGIYVVALDHTSPKAKLKSRIRENIRIALTDHGAGIDENSISVVCDGVPIAHAWDEKSGEIALNLSNHTIGEDVTLKVTVSDRTGNSTSAEFAATLDAKPGQIFVNQNYPNPFNPTTHISFEVTSEQEVKIIVYDLLGRRVRELADKCFTPGVHQVSWDAKDDYGREVASGAYIYRVIAGKHIETRKMLFLR